MNKYWIKIDADDLEDIRDISRWYDTQNARLGKRSQNTVISQINHLAENPYI